ncbi:MAG: hypothetical protein WCV79_01510 [Candidatus Paceibacterota bacterium]|jgi:hypothetical protein
MNQLASDPYFAIREAIQRSNELGKKASAVLENMVREKKQPKPTVVATPEPSRSKVIEDSVIIAIGGESERLPTPVSLMTSEVARTSSVAVAEQETGRRSVGPNGSPVKRFFTSFWRKPESPQGDESNHGETLLELTPNASIRIGCSRATVLQEAIKPSASDHALATMDRPGFRVAKKPQGVQLVYVPLRQLVNSAQGTVGEIMTPMFLEDWSGLHLRNQTLTLCGSEDGPRLVEQISGWEPGISLMIAMERLGNPPRPGYSSDPRVFTIQCDDAGCVFLRSDTMKDHQAIPPDSILVCRLISRK